MTGEYTCAVQTFESTDKRSARLQIIGMCSVFVTFYVCMCVCVWLGSTIHMLYAYCFLFNLYTIQVGCIRYGKFEVTHGATLLNMINISQKVREALEFKPFYFSSWFHN